MAYETQILSPFYLTFLLSLPSITQTGANTFGCKIMADLIFKIKDYCKCRQIIINQNHYTIFMKQFENQS